MSKYKGYCIAVIGTNGTGKSTWMKNIIDRYKRNVLILMDDDSEEMFDVYTVLEQQHIGKFKGKAVCYPPSQKKLKIDFIDVDKEIEKELGMSITKIFETKGENFFRKIEEKITLGKLKSNSSVIALGGGAFTNKKIRKNVLKNHLSFWLNWNDEILLNRIKNSKKRPLAFNSSDNELIDLIKKRSNVYSKALYEIKCDNLSKNQIVKRILEIYETH